MSFYPPEIERLFSAPEHASCPDGANGAGTGASFACGAATRFFLRIDPQTKEIRDAGFKSSGCGFAVAAAEVLAAQIVGRKLTELHGLEDRRLAGGIEAALGAFPSRRHVCRDIGFAALRRALADFRAGQIEEFAGEKALVCTCFGVAEETIEQVIAANRIDTADEVADICRAGGGCGACRFLIQEMIDAYWRENF